MQGGSIWTPLVQWLIFKNINRMDLIFFQSNLWDIRKLFGIGKWHFWTLKNIFQDFEIKIYRKTRRWFTTVVEIDISLNRIFSKAKRFFVNIFWSMCRMIVVFFRAWRYDLAHVFKYIKYCYTTRRKFSKGLWKTFLSKNMYFGSIIMSTQSVWECISQKSKSFYVSWHIIRLTCHMTLILFRVERYDLRRPSQYIKYRCTMCRKFSKSLFKKFWVKKQTFL